MFSKMRNILNKYKDMSNPAKASIWFVICNILQKGISLLTTPIFTRILTVEEFGTYSIYQSWYSIITIFATLYLFSGVYNNFLVKYPKDKNNFTTSMVGLTFFCTAILVIVYVFAPSFWNGILDLSTPLVIAIFVQSVTFAIFGFWAKQQRFEYKYRLLVLLTIIISIFSPILAIVLIKQFSNFRVEMRVWGFIAINLVISILILLVFMKKSLKFFSFKYWKIALIFSLPLVPHYLSQVVLAQSDRIMINNLIGKEAAGIYSLAYSISLMMTVVTQAINDTIIPFTYQSIKNHEEYKLKKVTSGCTLLVAVGCCLAMILSPEIIKIFASSEYYEAIKIMPIIAAAVFFMFLYTLYGNIEFYYEKTTFVMIASLIAAGLNVGLNYIFIKIYGYFAAAYTTLICYIIYVLMHYLFSRYICRKKLGVNSIYNNRFILLLSVIVVLFSLISVLIADFWYIRLSILVIIILIVLIFRKKIIVFMSFILKRNNNFNDKLKTVDTNEMQDEVENAFDENNEQENK